MAARAAPRRRDWSWRSQALRGLVYQVLAVALVAGGLWYLAHNTLANMQARGIRSGFDFLWQPAGFDIGESVIPFDALDPYWKAFAAGVLNTLRVAVVGIVLATLLGSLLGIGRFSRNALVRGICYAYVEVFRNVPVLLQLLMWYLIVADMLPPVAEPLSVAGLFWLSKNGFAFPSPLWNAGLAFTALGGAAGLALAWAYRRWARRHFERTGQPRSRPMPAARATGDGWPCRGPGPDPRDLPKKGAIGATGSANRLRTGRAPGFIAPIRPHRSPRHRRAGLGDVTGQPGLCGIPERPEKL